jgi:hypothetical protein
VSRRRRREPAETLDLSVERELSHLAKLTTKLGDSLEEVIDKLLAKNELAGTGDARDAEPQAPSADWVRAYRAYEMSVSGLAEQRRKNALVLAGESPTGDVPLGDVEYEAAVDEMVQRRIDAMDEQRLGRLVLDRMSQETKT